jgi:galactokinase/mevalonate kinase-like predicted kinase
MGGTDAANHQALQYLITLPPRMAEAFETLEERPRPRWLACADPSGKPLGSGGATAHLLNEAWRATAPDKSFADWLRADRKLVLHAGGQSRRLPAYAPTGKLLMPIPVFRWARGQRLNQTLLDLQLPAYERVLLHAGEQARVLITSGDVLLRFARELPPFPQADVVGLGMWVTPEKAQEFGVFFSPRKQPESLAFFLQKPPAEKIRELAQEHLYLVDTGMWLLSERAVNLLMVRCGWDATGQRFGDGRARSYELYAGFGLALGTKAAVKDPELNALSCAVVPLPEAEFYHFGTTAQMIESVSALQNLVLDETKLGGAGGLRHPDQYLQNSRFQPPLRRQQNHTLWIENSVIGPDWKLAHEQVLTGVPENAWDLRLEAGVCLDVVPVGESDFCVRAYGFRDTFSGVFGKETSVWLGRPAAAWFVARSLNAAECGIAPGTDLQQCALFPVMKSSELNPRFVEWMFALAPPANTAFASLWRTLPRLSARDISEQVNVRRVYEQRASLREKCLGPLMRNFRWSVFFRLDLESTARLFATGAEELPEVEIKQDDEPLQVVHERMFRAAVLRRRGQPQWEKFEEQAFAHLRQMIIHEAQLQPATPRCNVLEDQIIWARSPVRLDLAGGWTDTPPYCIEQGGKVLNVAVDLNGQPPIQVFAKLSPRPELVIRSIDLGEEERVRTYEELDTFAKPGSPFGLAKAAFALAGFLPRFHANGGFRLLEKQLREFGGGIEVSLLAAVPKGSGLGTSSILAATTLAAIGELCGLNWDNDVLFRRTLALEQMLTTGGGWQDQAGAIYRGIKLVETSPGLRQKPQLRWLPQHLFEHDYANKSILLYYTGITRLAKNILAEIVRGIFLNSPSHLALIDEIGANADVAAAAIQRCDYDGLVAAIRNSWRLNQALDSGTNPPEVQAIFDRAGDYLAAAKLLGAGGGGYLLMFAKDELAAERIKQRLAENPPNSRARFVTLELSNTGLQVTRS